MTIETRLSFPKGGTECPPNNTSNSPPPVSNSGNSSNNGGGNGDICSVVMKAKRRINENGSNKKRKKVKKTKHGKTELPGSTSCSTVSEFTGDSNDISNVSSNTLLKTEAGEGGRREAHTPVAVASSSSAKNVDLKKPSKVKCTCQASKDETKSRKSMRLRLRKGMKGENGYEPLVFESSPRYFETLANGFEFNQENKICFLGALGLSLWSAEKEIKDKLALKGKVECICGSMQEQAEKLRNENLKQGEKNLMSGGHTVGETKSSKPSTEGSYISVRISAIPKDNENGTSNFNQLDSNNPLGWERWVDRLPLSEWAKQKTKHDSPSQTEINDCMKRLENLGTGVKLVPSGVNICVSCFKT